MGNIDELHFEVILTDKDFQNRVKKDIELAKELNTSLSDALNIKKHVQSAGTKEYRRDIESVSKATKEIARNQRDYNKQVSNSKTLLKTLSQLTGVAFSVVGARQFLSTLVEVTGQFEVQKMALRNMIQDIDKADKIFQDLYEFSSKSTYRFSELSRYAKQLAAFNIESDDLLETTKRLGDVASGVGVSMDRIILAYGHVKSSGFLRGIQLRSFAQNGVPVLEELAKMLTELEGKAVSLGDVFDKMMKREITFEMVEEAFRRMTSEGGKFYQMQEVLAKTLAGQINILKGKWENLMYAIGESQDGVLKGIVSALTKMVSSTEEFGKALTNAIIVFGAYRAAALATTAITDGLAVATGKGLLGALKKVGMFIKSNPYALLAAAAASLVLIAVRANQELTSTQKIVKALDDTTEKYNSSLRSEMGELNLLIGRMKSAREGTDEYKSAKLALEKRFDPYIQKLKEEGVEVDNLATLYEGLANKISDANKQRFLESAQKSIKETYESGLDSIESRTVRYISEINGIFGRKLTGFEEGAIRHYISTGEKNDTFQSLGLESLYGGVYKNGAVYQESESFYDKLHNLYNENVSIYDAYADAMVEAAKRFDAAKEKITETGTPPTQKISAIISAIQKADKQITELRAKAQREGLTLEESDTLKKAIEGRDEDVALYKLLTGKDYDKTGAGGGESRAVRSLKNQISLLEKYRSAREKLEPYFGAETDSTLASIFGSETDYTTLDAQILKLCASLRELGEDGAEAAEQIETRLGLDSVSGLVSRAKAISDYQKALAKLNIEYSGNYSGVEHDVDDIWKDMVNAQNRADEETQDAIDKAAEAYGKETDVFKEQLRILNELNAAKKEGIRIDAQNKLDNLAKGKASEMAAGFNMSDWSDKSLRQVREIWEGLSGLAAGDITIDDALKERLASAGLTIENFTAKTKEELLEMSEEAREEYYKKVGSLVQRVTGDFTTVATAVQGYAEAVGNSSLATAAETFAFASDTIGNFASKIISGDVFGAVSGLLSTIVSGFFEGAKAIAEFERSLREANEQMRVLSVQQMMEVDSIFGESGLNKINKAAGALGEIQKHMDELSGSMPTKFRDRKNWWYWAFIENFNKPLGQTTDRFNRYSIQELADSVGGPLYDAYGNLNAETLQTILETYKNLESAERDWIDSAIKDSKLYAEAMDDLKAVVSDVFGQIATSAADRIVDTWHNAGDAALDYAEILDDVAKSYAKMIAQSMLIDSVFTPEFRKQLLGFVTDNNVAGAMDLVLGGLEQMQQMAPVIADALEPLRSYISYSAGEEGSLGAGINKELVEGNSSLIASYINAMRADLSVMRTLAASGWGDVREMREFVPSCAEYLAQIAGNTFDTAQASNEILSRLRSMITISTNGGSALRTTR